MVQVFLPFRLHQGACTLLSYISVVVYNVLTDLGTVLGGGASFLAGEQLLF